MMTCKNRTLVIEGQRALAVIKAIDSEVRLSILDLLSDKPINFSMLTIAMGIPHSTVNFNLKLLEEAELLDIQYMPGKRGRQKLIRKRYEEVLIKLP